MASIGLVIIGLILWAVVDVRATGHLPGKREETMLSIVFFGGVFAMLIGLMFVVKSNENSSVLRAVHEAKELRRVEVLKRR